MKRITAVFVSVIMFFYGTFPTLPVFDFLRKYFPPSDKAEVYMLAPDKSSLMESFVIKTPNNKIIVMDGGIMGKGENSEPYLPAAIRAILGLGRNDYFEVEAWFLSHIHNDHYYELAKMMLSYNEKSNYKINNFYFSFPEPDEEKPYQEKLHEGFDNYYRVNGLIDDSVTDRRAVYDSLNGRYINDKAVDDGLTVTVDGVSMDVLLNWAEGYRIVNSSSVVYRLRYNGHSILFLGDSYVDTGKRLLEKYSPDELKSEYVQLAHHGQSGTDREFYDAIDARNSKRLWCMPDWVWFTGPESPYRAYETRNWMGLPENADEFTDTGMDYVVALYEHFPKHPEKVRCWTNAVLDGQRVASF